MGSDDAMAVAACGAEPSDEELCGRAAARDSAAFEELVRRHQQRAHRIAWTVLRDAEEAREVSQEAFLRLFERAGQFDGRARFTTWFHRLLVNLCLDRRRRERWWWTRRSSAEDRAAAVPAQETAASSADPASALGRKRLVKRVWKAADELSVQQRAALVLTVQEDLSGAEVAAVLGCSEPTARVHLHRALSTLRRRLAGEA
jgi:RNA polymerase sigma-70 factor, ECF subfamily